MFFINLNVNFCSIAKLNSREICSSTWTAKFSDNKVYVTEYLWWLLLKKDGCRRRNISDGIFINEKEKKSSIAKKVVREIFLLYHSLPFAVTRCHSYHSLPLDLPLVCLFLNDPFSTVLSDSKVYQTLFVHSFSMDWHQK